MRRILFLVFILCLLNGGKSSAQSSKDSLWFRTHYTKSEQMIKMRDGVKLFTAIYRPIDTISKHPILMMRTPYSCAPYEEQNYRELGLSSYASFIKAGYIFVFQDVRGRYMSEGNFEDIRPLKPIYRSKTETDEATDTYDAIEWLINNVPGNNHKVGIFGISYPGFYATTAALSGHPALKAVSPQAPVTDWFRGDDFHHNGAFALQDAFGFYLNFGQPRKAPLKQYPSVKNQFSQDAYDFFLRSGSIKEIKANYFGDSIQFWNQVFSHPDLDTFWNARNPIQYLKNIAPAMMVVGGLFDAEDCYGAWTTYRALVQQSPKTQKSLVMGPWFHGNWGGRGSGSGFGNIKFNEPTADWYQNEFEFPFFNYYLNNDPNPPRGKNVKIFFTGENKWHDMDVWPPENTTDLQYFINSNNKLDRKQLYNKEVSDVYTSDPAHPVPYQDKITWHRTREYMLDDQRFAARRPDVLSYETDILSEDLTLCGPIVADLFVKLSSTDADFIVKVIDVFPNDFSEYKSENTPMQGYQMLVRGEIMRGRYRNSFSNPEAFKPGKVTQVKYTLPDIAHTFKKGHRLMIQIQSSWFPLFDLNPQQFINIYTANKKDFIKSNIEIMRTREFPSSIHFSKMDH